MNILNAYYHLKPIIPRRIQILIRRKIATYKRKAAKNIWPIHPEASRRPFRWSGWPSQKQFSLVLSHDVDTRRGLDRCAQLLALESELGFKSSFNFVAEDYELPDGLLHKINQSGFEVGLHGLAHDGKLFSNRKVFDRSKPRINYYLRKWNIYGFHSPSMHRNLDWIADLDIQYDNSTFDTDPFEPQPDGVKTVFPLWITNESKTRGYVELPYTLPQDHCIFIILKENNISIWKKKLDWIAEKGGMAFLNTHPDYMNFRDHKCRLEEYPARFYREFLEYVNKKYAGQYWHTLPRDVARFWKETVIRSDRAVISPPGTDRVQADSAKVNPDGPPTPTGVRIWIDLDNTPHVPFFIPIIQQLEGRGHQIVLTARDAFQVCELADEKRLAYIKIGRHYGKSPFLKLFGLFWRSIQLGLFFLHNRPSIALSHGSRSQIFYGNLMRVPTVVIADYEHAQTIPFAHPRWSIVPESIPVVGLSSKVERVRHYRGIKEDAYVPQFAPNASILKDLGLSENGIIITVRPPADEAHYHNPESDVLLAELMKRAVQTKEVQIVLLPRNIQQEHAYRLHNPLWFTDGKTIVPPKAIDGLNLLWSSDLVVSGGGTMNREAAALGIPVYSIFRGKTGAVDRMLERAGRLVMIHTPEEIWTKIKIVRRDKQLSIDHKPRPALEDIVNHIEDIMNIEQLRSQG